MADAGQFQIELEPGHAVIRAAEFEIHVSEMIFRTNDIGQQFVAFQLSIFAVLSYEADGNSGDHSLHWHTRVHESEHSTAHARH